MKPLLRACLLALLGLAPAAWAELTIQITQGADKPTPIAIVPFSWQGGGTPKEDVSGIVRADFGNSGTFKPLNPANMISHPRSQSEVVYRDWRALGQEYLVIGSVSRQGGAQPIVAQFELYDVYRQQRLMVDRVQGNENQWRDIAHAISDKIYQRLTGIPGIFSTKMLYVTETRSNNRRVYNLFMADIDGARERRLLQSGRPIVSPSWSPNGREIAYVSFESSRPAIYRQQLSTGHREKLTSFKGLNGAPVYSPDGSRLAMTLSKDGNPEIYVMDVGSRRLTRMTTHPAIDTEPTWTPDGRALLFTSDRGGKPQIYKVTLGGGLPERVTFEGGYNARAQALPNGRGFVYIRGSGGLRVAVQDFATGRSYLVSNGPLDKSPSVAPNSNMVLYSSRYGGRDVLSIASVDGKIQYRLPARSSDVREPAWSPFMNR